MKALFNPRAHLAAFREVVTLLTRRRQLTWAMARREIGERYAGQVLGSLWLYGHPLLLMAVYVIIFAYVFKLRFSKAMNLPLDYPTFLLSGLAPWLFFLESMNKSATAVTTNASLVKQVVFPIEVLPIKTTLVTLLGEAIALSALTLYVLLTQGGLLWSYLLLPVVLVLQAMFMFGIAYAFSAIGVFFRDLKDIVQVLSLISIYLLPIIYLPGSTPRFFEYVLFCNPFSHMIWVFQDVMFYGRFAHPLSWIVFVVLSFGVFDLGYCVFRRTKTAFGNVL